MNTYARTQKQTQRHTHEHTHKRTHKTLSIKKCPALHNVIIPQSKDMKQWAILGFLCPLPAPYASERDLQSRVRQYAAERYTVAAAFTFVVIFKDDIVAPALLFAA